MRNLNPEVDRWDNFLIYVTSETFCTRTSSEWNMETSDNTYVSAIK